MKTIVKQGAAYQLSCLFSPLANEDGANKAADKIRAWITEQGGAITNSGSHKVDNIQRRSLSYPMQKYQEALAWCLYFTLVPDKIGELKKRLDKSKDVIRAMIVKSPRIKPEKKKIETLNDFKIVDKIEPLPAIKGSYTPAPEPPKAPEQEAQESIARPHEKVRLEELDRKLEEILNQ